MISDAAKPISPATHTVKPAREVDGTLKRMWELLEAIKCWRRVKP